MWKLEIYSSSYNTISQQLLNIKRTLDNLERDIQNTYTCCFALPMP